VSVTLGEFPAGSNAAASFRSPLTATGSLQVEMIVVSQPGLRCVIAMNVPVSGVE